MTKLARITLQHSSYKVQIELEESDPLVAEIAERARDAMGKDLRQLNLDFSPYRGQGQSPEPKPKPEPVLCRALDCHAPAGRWGLCDFHICQAGECDLVAGPDGWCDRHRPGAVVGKKTRGRPRKAPVPAVVAGACSPCSELYGDSGPCDEGKPQCSPHRKKDAQVDACGRDSETGEVKP